MSWLSLCSEMSLSGTRPRSLARWNPGGGSWILDRQPASDLTMFFIPRCRPHFRENAKPEFLSSWSLSISCILILTLRHRLRLKHFPETSGDPGLHPGGRVQTWKLAHSGLFGQETLPREKSLLMDNCPGAMSPGVSATTPDASWSQCSSDVVQTTASMVTKASPAPRSEVFRGVSAKD